MPFVGVGMATFDLDSVTRRGRHRVGRCGRCNRSSRASNDTKDRTRARSAEDRPRTPAAASPRPSWISGPALAHWPEKAAAASTTKGTSASDRETRLPVDGRGREGDHADRHEQREQRDLAAAERDAPAIVKGRSAVVRDKTDERGAERPVRFRGVEPKLLERTEEAERASLACSHHRGEARAR